MKPKLTQLICTVLFSAISLHSIAGESFVEEKSFDLKNIKSLVLKIDHAEITLVQGENNELKMTLSQELKRGNEDVCLHKISHSLKADILEIYTEAKKRSSFSNCNIHRSVQIQLDQETIQNLNMQHGHGSLSADAFTPKQLSLSISHSKLTLGKIASTTAKLNFGHTNANIQTITSEKLEISGAHGNVEINRSQANQFTAQQSHGDLILKAHQGTELNLHNAHGGITVSKGQAETVELTNSHGSINYSGNSSTLRYSNKHGPTKIAQHNADFKYIEGKSTHGSVELTLPKNSLCELEGAVLKKVSADMFKKDGTCDEDEPNGLVKVHTTHGQARINTL